MATITLAKAFYHSGPHKIKWVGEAAGPQSFKIGHLVYLSSGLATVCADDAQVVFGMALQDASGAATATPTVPVLLALPETELVMNVYHSTAASAVTALSKVGENYAIQVDSNKCYCDIEDATNVCLRVRELYGADTIGDQYGRVVVSVQANYSQTDQAG